MRVSEMCVCYKSGVLYEKLNPRGMTRADFAYEISKKL